MVKKEKETLVPKIRMTDVCKAFGNKKVLNHLNLDVYPGESLVVIGGSGTGKSVTIKCILGLLEPDSGIVEIDGKNVLELSEKEREQSDESESGYVSSARKERCDIYFYVL